MAFEVWRAAKCALARELRSRSIVSATSDTSIEVSGMGEGGAVGCQEGERGAGILSPLPFTANR